MSTSLTIPNKLPSFLANREVDTSMNSKLLGGLGGGMPLPMLSIRGKEFRLRSGGNEVSLKTRELDVVIVAGRDGLSKRYYDSTYNGSDEITAPICWSQDGHTPDAADPQSETCASCPLNAWGSATRNGRQSKGKACQDYKRLVVWPIIGKDGASLAQHCVLDIPPSSLKAPRGSNETMFREYVQALAKHNLAPDIYVVRLGFTDAEYPQLTFSPQRLVTEAEYARIAKMKDDPDTEEVLNGEAVLEEAGPVTQVDEDEAPKRKPGRPKGSTKKAAEPAPEKVEEPEPDIRTKPEDRGSDDEDEVEDAPAGDDDIDSVLGSIADLLKGAK